jgi:predicted phosphoribosyltransferase
LVDILERLNRRLQFRFKDRISAGKILAEALKDVIKKDGPNLMVLGIPRGGVVMADIIAKKLSAPYFDIVIPRKLTDPDNKEHAIGAIMEDGTFYIDEELIQHLYINREYIEREKANQIEEIKRRNSLYRKSSSDYDFRNKTIILVDDGAATGATAIVAARSIRNHKNKPKCLIIALPVSSKDTAILLEKECDRLEVIIKPSTGFRAVAQYYQDFTQITDEQVIQIMNSGRNS